MSTQHGPWTIQKSTSVYQNPWIQVREDRVTGKEGNAALFGIVTIGDGLSVLALDDEDNVYLTREFHYAAGEETIEVVSGGLNKDEDPQTGAKRELREELGIEAGEWEYLGLVQGYTTLVSGKCHLFLARNLRFYPVKPESGEYIEPIKMPLAQAVDMAMKGDIFQAPSCVLLLKTWIHLQK
jgi:ADP-ribose pyrophosphatase